MNKNIRIHTLKNKLANKTNTSTGKNSFSTRFSQPRRVCIGVYTRGNNGQLTPLDIPWRTIDRNQDKQRSALDNRVRWWPGTGRNNKPNALRTCQRSASANFTPICRSSHRSTVNLVRFRSIPFDLR